MKTSMFPPAAERKAWDKARKVPHNRKFSEQLIADAEKISMQSIPDLPAHLFMEYVQNGNRANYEKPYLQRRNNLIELIMAESFEYKGRFIPCIIDYLWAITSEHTWSFPAHVPATGDPLPDQPYETVDLFAAETGMLLARTLNLLEDKLAGISPNLVRMVRRQLLTRIVEPLEIKPFPFWWGAGANNWTPWCSSNCLGAALTVLQDDPPRLKKIIKLLSGLVELYIEKYPEDGGCDEGPTYWAVSPAVMMRFYEQLQTTLPDNPKLKRMGEYIADACMSETYLAAFADAGTSTKYVPIPMCYRYGERVGSAKMKNLALSLLQTGVSGIPPGRYEINSALEFVFWPPAEFKAPKLPEKSVAWYGETELLFAKDNGLSLAAKGGHNAENHNHIDVGQFIIINQDKPVIIDLGVSEYTRFTFSDRRYENRAINADSHNIPQFNGFKQQPGKEFRAEVLEFRKNKEGCVLKLDLSKAYPAEAKLRSCIRTITYDFAVPSIEIHDEWELAGRKNTVVIPLYTPGAVKKLTDHSWQVQNMVMNLSGDCNLEVEKQKITDSKLLLSWGKSLNCLTLTTSSGSKGEHKLTFLPKGSKK